MRVRARVGCQKNLINGGTKCWNVITTTSSVVEKSQITPLTAKEYLVANHTTEVLFYCSQHLRGLRTGERALRVLFGTG
jgi:hypothetical protein